MKKSFKRKCIEFFARRGQKSDALAENQYRILSFFYQTLPATSASILAYHFSYQWAQYYYMGTIYASPTLFMLYGLLGAVIVWFIVLFADFIASRYCQSILKKEKEQEEQRTQKVASELGHKIKFYQECKANGVTDITDAFDRKKAELIAQRLGYHYGDIEQYYREAEIAANQKR
jgi:hypothetical protein